MCTLLVGVDRPRSGMLLLGANRDESLNRPALSPHVLVREPRIVAGRDSLAGGTWLGVQERHLAVALLNRAAPERAGAPGATWSSGGEPDRSRGLLCLDALRMDSAAQALTWVGDEVLTCRYAPFTLFVADAEGAHCAYWDGHAMRGETLRPGWHAITHVDADDVFDARTDLALTLLRQSPPRALEDLVPALSSHEGGRAICLHADGHGTVSSSLVQLAWGDSAPARLLHAAGRPCVTPFQDLSSLLA
jgi:uncharacterized protein with NRDE domain